MAIRFKDTISINEEYTFPSQDGTADQVLATDGAGNISFVNGGGETVKIECKNTSGSTITKGTPVYVTGTVGSSFRVEVAAADASNSAKMPAVGLLETDLANNGEGYVVTGGLLKNLTTDPIDGTTPSSNDTIYVKSGGGLTMTKPTGSNLIQNIGKVGRVNSSNAGSIIVSSILRTNDVPNLTEGKIWVGSTNNTIESTVVHIDETNTRIGINQNTPDVTLDITGTDAIQIPKGTDAERPTPESGMLRFNTTSAEFEGYNGTEWGAIGGSEVASVDVDSFTGDGTTVDYTLTSEIPDEKTTQVYIDGVYQSKGNYSVSGTTLTFSTAPPNGTAIEVVHFTAIAESTLNGSGTANYITKWQDANTLANSIIFDNGTNIGIGTSSPGYPLHIEGTDSYLVNINNTAQDPRIQFQRSGTTYGHFSAGNSLFTMYSNPGTDLRFMAGGTERIRVYANGEIAFKNTSGSDAFFWNNTYSRLGIGTTSPVVKLNVVGSAYFSGNDAWNGGGSEGNRTDIALVIDEGDAIYTRDNNLYLRTLIKKDTGDNIQIGEAATSLIDNINFFSGSSCSYTWHNNASAAMKLTSTGLGIGTTSPSEMLDVTDNISVGVTRSTSSTQGDSKLILKGKNLLSGSNYYGDYGQILFNATSNYTGSARKWLITNSLDAYKFAIINGGANQATPAVGAYGGITTGTPSFVIDHNDNVGIGTTSPADIVHIQKNGTGSYTTTTIRNANSTAYLNIGVAGSAVADSTLRNNAYIIVPTAADLLFRTSNSERMRITSGGQVSISANGSVSSSADLTILRDFGSGTAIAIESTNTSNTAYVGQRFILNGFLSGAIIVSSTGTTYNSYSDYRLKENVVKLTGALDRVDALKPSRFNFIADPTKTVDGFLAHEVADVVPEAISGTKDEVDEEGNPVYQGMDQSKLVPLLVGAIQELRAEIETLKSQINP